MKTIEEKEIPNLPGEALAADKPFSFRCHAELSCFNRCCRNLNLYLYPYDVLRLKNNLKMSSDLFLEKHVDVVMRPDSFFPEVLLHMAENDEQTCPFLRQTGCSVYSDRPDTCRMFPVEHGIRFNNSNVEPVYIYRPPDFCLGRHEANELTKDSWIKDQDAALHNKMTVQWANVKQLFVKDPWGREGPNGKKAKMAFMAAYNVDRFREFIFQSTFLKRYKLKSALIKKIEKDDTELLQFGYKWIKLFVWNMPCKEIRMRRQ